MIKCEACLNEVDEVVEYAGQDVCQPCYSDVGEHLDLDPYEQDDTLADMGDFWSGSDNPIEMGYYA